MKKNFLGTACELSVCVGIFGCYCLARASYGIYILKSFVSFFYKGGRHFPPDVISVVKLSHKMIYVGLTVFSVIGLTAVVSALGIFWNKKWAARTWLITSTILTAYFLLTFYRFPSGWFDYGPGIALCAYSWFILWYMPRRQRQALA